MQPRTRFGEAAVSLVATLALWLGYSWFAFPYVLGDLAVGGFASEAFGLFSRGILALISGGLQQVFSVGVIVAAINTGASFLRVFWFVPLVSLSLLLTLTSVALDGFLFALLGIVSSSAVAWACYLGRVRRIFASVPARFVVALAALTGVTAIGIHVCFAYLSPSLATIVSHVALGIAPWLILGVYAQVPHTFDPSRFVTRPAAKGPSPSGGSPPESPPPEPEPERPRESVTTVETKQVPNVSEERPSTHEDHRG